MGRRRILMEGRTPHTRAVSHGTKPLARRAQGRSSTTTLFREPISQHSPTMLQLSLQSSITAWAAWKLMKIQLCWALTQRQSGVCTQLVRSREACTVTIDWEATLSWIALFSAVWQELLVQSTCWVTK